MADTVTIYINGEPYQVPKGANLVDAAKLHGIKIPVFCYHPKLDPVGMCRMCLVELGNVSVNKETGKQDVDGQGKPVIRWFPKLQTACTQKVTEGLAVRTTTEKVIEGREDILEFLLTSHPLDCPICDKGGECPLQNLTMAYGPGMTRFEFDDKMRLDKHVPLGELIYLDRERCIQCARCTRFCDEIVGDDVLAFHDRGRRLQIVTISDPPFNTKFSGNTTDICPVGALTTADFRFGARPWEMESVPSICPHCPVGCNLTADIRQDREAGGIKIIKRIMPRQNEQVNEIWICDKGRWGHHHTRADNRLKTPMVRGKDGSWTPIDWQTAYKQIAAKLKNYGDQVGFLAGPSLSNEDYWGIRRTAELVSSKPRLGMWPATMTGADAIAQVGVGMGTRIQDIGAESAILVIASDFEEEAPVWWLQVKQAADRGVKVVVANGRSTKMDKYAHAVIHYDYNQAVLVLNGFTGHALNAGKTPKGVAGEGAAKLKALFKKAPTSYPDVADILLNAQNLIIFAGGEGMTLAEHGELMQAAANLLIVSGHTGRANNGLVAVWPGANLQGAVDMGFSPEATQSLFDTPPAMWVISSADVVTEDIRAAYVIDQAEYVVVTSQFMTPTAEHADIVLPVQSFAEREGSFTNGMRRVQRFYVLQGIVGDSLPDWKIFGHIMAQLGGDKPHVSAAAVMQDITRKVPRYAEMSYTNLSHIEDQFPDVGGDDLYFGGTSYSNRGGLGVQWAADAEKSTAHLNVRPVTVSEPGKMGKHLVVVPTQVLYDHDPLFEPSVTALMHQRVPEPFAELNQEDAARLGITNGDRIAITVGDHRIEVTARVNGRAPLGVVLLPKQLSQEPVPAAPLAGTVEKI